MKKSVKILSVLLAAVMTATAFAGCSGSSSEDSQAASASGTASKEKYGNLVNVYMWSEYIPQEIFDGFEQETGIHVNAAYYASNEELIAKITAGAGSQYDLIQPTVNRVPILVKGNYIEPLDFSEIPNEKYLDEDYQHVDGYSDYQKYFSVYMGSRELVAYNAKTCPIKIKSLNDLTNPALKKSLVVTDGPDLIEYGLSAMGIDPYTTKEADYAKAAEWAQKLYPNIKAVDGDSPKTEFMNGEVSAGLIYDGDLAILMKSDPDIKIAQVSEKMPSAPDVWSVPKGAQHKREAEALINYILKPENFAKCLEAYPYCSPSAAATKLTSDDFKNNPVHNLGSYEKTGFYVERYTGMDDVKDKFWTKISAK